VPPPLPLPRAAAAVALGDVPIEDIPAVGADDDEPSQLAALLAMPTGEARRARKATLPPPPPQIFPIAEEVAQDLPQVAQPRPSAPGKMLAIAVGALVVLIVVLVFALRGEDGKQTVVQSAESPTGAAPESPPPPSVGESPTPVEKTVPAAADPAGAREAPVAEETTGSAAGSADEVDIEIELPDAVGSGAETPVAVTGAASATTPVATGAGSAITTATTATATIATPPVSKPRSTLSALLKGKEVVLEYDGRIGKNSAPASEQAAIAKARSAYATGTQRLNARDFDGALDSYRQALSHYPGYIGAYRGMGLAYERKGDKVNALKALRMYVSIVPNATDVAALRKRIDALSKR
jgi:hypothetical protein